MSGPGLALTLAMPIVIAAMFVVAMAVSRWALASVAKAQAEASADAAVSMVPFGELPEPAVRAVMTNRRALVVVAGKDFEGEK